MPTNSTPRRVIPKKNYRFFLYNGMHYTRHSRYWHHAVSNTGRVICTLAPRRPSETPIPDQIHHYDSEVVLNNEYLGGRSQWLEVTRDAYIRFIEGPCDQNPERALRPEEIIRTRTGFRLPLPPTTHKLGAPKGKLP